MTNYDEFYLEQWLPALKLWSYVKGSRGNIDKVTRLQRLLEKNGIRVRIRDFSNR